MLLHAGVPMRFMADEWCGDALVSIPLVLHIDDVFCPYGLEDQYELALVLAKHGAPVPTTNPVA